MRTDSIRSLYSVSQSSGVASLYSGHISSVRSQQRSSTPRSLSASMHMGKKRGAMALCTSIVSIALHTDGRLTSGNL